jgi:putative ABC transport system substrate-binding protein
MADPIRTGVVRSLAHPEANLTGLSLGQGPGIAGKWVELLTELVPRLSSLAVISNPSDPLGQDIVRELNHATPSRNVKLRFFEVRGQTDLANAVQMAAQRAQAMLVLADPVTYDNQNLIISLAARHRIPATYTLLEFVDSGGLLAYSADGGAMGRRAAEYVDKILRGAKPADLPIEQPAQYSPAVNLRAAQALGITIPESILLRADEVIR